jgi:transcriptional regulator with XRE-family HTH domain
MSKQMTFAKRLEELRTSAGLSQYEVAKRTGLTRQTLSRLEMGDSEPSFTTVRLLAHVLGVRVEAFEVGELPLPDLKPARKRGRPARSDQVDQNAADKEPKK